MNQVLDALKDMVRFGEHDGPCTNLNEDGTINRLVPCEKHLEASRRRFRKAVEIIQEADPEWVAPSEF